jgi:hypothetical protein
VFFRTLSRKLTLPRLEKGRIVITLITQVVADYLSDRNKFKLDGVSFKSTQDYADGRGAKTGYNVVLFNSSSGVRHATDNTRRYQVELFENVEDDIYVFSPNIQLIAEEQKSRYLGLLAATNEKKDTLQMKTDGMTYHKITGVKFRTSKTEIRQGKL